MKDEPTVPEHGAKAFLDLTRSKNEFEVGAATEMIERLGSFFGYGITLVAVGIALIGLPHRSVHGRLAVIVIALEAAGGLLALGSFVRLAYMVRKQQEPHRYGIGPEADDVWHDLRHGGADERAATWGIALAYNDAAKINRVGNRALSGRVRRAINLVSAEVIGVALIGLAVVLTAA